MDAFGEACSRLECAERDLQATETAFSRAVYLYLVREASAPDDALAAELCAKRVAVTEAIRGLRMILEKCRFSIRRI